MTNNRAVLESELTRILQKRAKQEWEAHYEYKVHDGWNDWFRVNIDDPSDIVEKSEATLRVKQKANEYLGELLPKITQLVQDADN